MKELDPLHQDNTKNVRQVNAPKPQGAWHLATGLKLWQIDPATEIPIEAVATMVRNVEKKLGDGLKIDQTALKVETNPAFFYCKAINPKNALRKLHKSKFYAAYRHRIQTQSNPS